MLVAVTAELGAVVHEEGFCSAWKKWDYFFLKLEPQLYFETCKRQLLCCLIDFMLIVLPFSDNFVP